MVIFKKGIMMVKKYEDLCPNSIYYIKAGNYIYLPWKDRIFIDDPFNNDYRFENICSLPFAIGLDIDFSRDQQVPLILKKDGFFYRTDGIEGSASIEDLFCKYDD